jgi:hypothetical protein
MIFLRLIDWEEYLISRESGLGGNNLSLNRSIGKEIWIRTLVSIDPVYTNYEENSSAPNPTTREWKTAAVPLPVLMDIGINLPSSDHPPLGVLSATRVGMYAASFQSGNRSANGNLMGIDRASFGQTAFFRSDYVTGSLNGLLNCLASTPNAVLVDQTTWERFNLEVGSTLDILVTINQSVFQTSFTVAGVFGRFPI